MVRPALEQRPRQFDWYSIASADASKQVEGRCRGLPNCRKLWQAVDGKLALSRRSHEAGEAKLDQLGTILPAIERRGDHESQT